MAIIINGTEIDSNSNYFSINFENGLIDIDYSLIDLREIEKTLFIGFPLDIQLVNNISQLELSRLKLKIKSNNAISINYKIIEDLHKYDCFFILMVGIDPQGVSFLKKLPEAFAIVNKRIVIIDTKSSKKLFNFS